MSLTDYTSDQYHKDRHPEFINSRSLINAWSEFAFLEYFNNVEGLHVLEFGGGLGTNLIHLVKKNSVWMVEPSNIGRKNAQNFNIRSVQNISELKKMNKRKFDIIFCRHVLEHVENPQTILIELKKVLKVNGELILVLPVEKSFKPIKDDIDFHLYSWNPRTACNLLKSADFHVIEWKFNFFTGKRVLLPIYNIFGVKYYRIVMKLLGRIFCSKEFIVRAKSI